MQHDFTHKHIEECRRIIKEGSKSFYFASLMLPVQMRFAATALYAFCRISDDIADTPQATLKSIDRLKKRISKAYAGMPEDHAADCAFSEVVLHYEIPELVPQSMVEGFEWDVTGKPYETISDVIDYSARVAGTVGVMMSIVMGRRLEATLARACDLGVAMQLINIARDVGEDAHNGRIYLPSQWLHEEGVDPKALLAKPTFTKELGRVVERLLDTADVIYQRGMTGISDLPTSCRHGIRAAGMVYAEIGQKVRKNGFNSIDQRAYTTRGRKLGLMFMSTGNPFDTSGADQSPALPEVKYLIDASAREEEAAFGDGEWLIDLFAEMDRRDREYLENARSPASLNVL
ncbi:MAG: phytoene/squalene synthase family protein [Pseudomonadota bacterium]